mgnify:CR=1 FL=1
MGQDHPTKHLQGDSDSDDRYEDEKMMGTEKLCKIQ